MKRAARVSETVIRHWPLVWAGLMGLLLLGAAGKASERLLWHDELFTLYASQLSPSALWEALADGLDLQPPLGYLVTRITTSTLGDGLVAMRVPSLVGFGLGCVCLGLFVKRRVGLAGGTVALLVPSVTAGYDYAYEARPYGMLLGLTGVALLLWQATERPRSRLLAALGLAIALAVAVSLHYYGVLLVAPLAVGESLRIRRGTPGGIPVWLAMAAGCAPLLAYLPLMGAASEYGALFWTRPSFGQVPYTYRYFLYPILLPLFLCVLGVGLYRLLFPNEPPRSTATPATMPTPELGVSIVLLLLPVLAVAVGFVVGGYRHRYAIPMVLGLGGVIGLLAGTSRSLRPVTLLAVLVGWLVVRSVGYAIPLWSNSPPDPLARHPMLKVAMHEPAVPILLSNDATYTQLRHYGPPELVRRLAIAMPPHDMAAPRFEDSSERAMRALDRWRPIALEEYDTIKQRAGTFLVYGDARWLILQLIHDGARVELVGEGFGQQLLRVTLPDQAGHS